MSKQQVVTCKECGKRRVKALTTNPITGKQRRSTIKICQDCHSKTIDYKFFSSSFGQWLRRAFQRQCTNSIPSDTNELRALLHLWKFYRQACGFKSDGQEVTKTYDYHLCHIDPIKGEGELVGKLTYSNLMIAPAKLNREHSNLPFPFTSKQSVLKGENITDSNFKDICRERYNLPLLAAEFCLIPQKKGEALTEFTSSGVNISTTLSKELKRLGYPVTQTITNHPPQTIERLANGVYDTFFKVGGTLALKELAQHGTQCDNSMIEYDFTLPHERVKMAKEARKQLEKEVAAF